MKKIKKKNIFLGVLGLSALFVIPTVFGVLNSCSSSKNTSNLPQEDDSMDESMFVDKEFIDWIVKQLELEINYLEDTGREKFNSGFEKILSELDDLKSPEILKYFNLQKIENSNLPSINYSIGDEFKVQPNFSKTDNKKSEYFAENTHNYKYYWFLNYPEKSESRNKRSVDEEGTKSMVFLRATNVPETTLYDLSNFDDGAILTCVQIDSSDPYGQWKENKFKNIDAQFWQTTLLLGQPFEISSPSVSNNYGGQPSTSSDSILTYLVGENNDIVFEANCSVNEKYKKYLKYQWFKKDINGSEGFKKLDNETSRTLSIDEINSSSSGIYKCVMYLEHNAELPSIDQSLPEFSEHIETTEFKINVVSSVEFSDTKQRYDVKIQGKNHQNEGIENFDSLSNIQEDDTFVVYPHIFLGDVDLNSLTGGNCEIKNVEFNWRKVEEISQYTGNEKNFSTGDKGELIFTNIKTTDEGGYICDVTVDFVNGGQLKYSTNELDIRVGEKGQINLRVENNGKFRFFNGNEYTINVDAHIPGYNNEVSEKIKFSWFYKKKVDSVEVQNEGWEPILGFNDKSLKLSKQQVYSLKNYDLKVKAHYEGGETYDLSPTDQERTLEVIVVDPIIDLSETNTDASELIVGNTKRLSINAKIGTSDGNNQIEGSSWKLAYQWYKQNPSTKNSWEKISGETKSNYNVSLDSIDLDKTKYGCEVKITNVLENTVQPTGKEFTLSFKEFSNDSITKSNVEDFRDKFQKISSPDIDVNELTTLIDKYLGVPEEDLEFIRLESSRTRSSTKTLKVKLKSKKHWSSTLSTDSNNDIYVEYGTQLVIKNINTTVSSIKINRMNFVSTIDKLKSFKTYDELKRFTSDNVNVLKDIADENSINHYSFDWTNSRVTIDENYTNFLSIDSNLKTVQIRVTLMPSEGYSFQDGNNEFSLNYEYLPRDRYNPNYIKQSLPIDGIKNDVDNNQSLDQVKKDNENSYFEVTRTTLNPIYTRTHLSQPLTYEYKYRITPKVNIENYNMIPAIKDDIYNTYFSELSNSLSSTYRSLWSPKLMNIEADNAGINLYVASRILAIDENSLSNLRNTLQLFTCDSFDSNKTQSGANHMILQALNLAGRSQIKVNKSSDGGYYEYNNNSIRWKGINHTNNQANGWFELRILKSKNYTISNKLIEYLQQSNNNLEFSEDSSQYVIKLTNIKYGNYTNYAVNDVEYNSGLRSFMIKKTPFQNLWMNNGSIRQWFTKVNNVIKNQKNLLDKIYVNNNKNSGTFVNRLLKKSLYNELANILNFGDTKGVSPIAGIYTFEDNNKQRGVYILFKEGFAIDTPYVSKTTNVYGTEYHMKFYHLYENNVLSPEASSEIRLIQKEVNERGIQTTNSWKNLFNCIFIRVKEA